MGCCGQLGSFSFKDQVWFGKCAVHQTEREIYFLLLIFEPFPVEEKIICLFACRIYNRQEEHVENVCPEFLFYFIIKIKLPRI